MFYAQINESNICVAVSNLTEKVQDTRLIPIGFMDVGLIGKKYENGEWVEVPIPEPQSTQGDRIEEKLNMLLEGTVSKEYMDYYTTVNTAILGGE